MKILYDHQAFTIQEYGGISRYFYELTRQAYINSEHEVSSSILFSNNEYVVKNEILKSTPFLKGINFRGKVRIMDGINKLKSLDIYRKDDFDLFHPTYYDPYYQKIKSKKPIVITFYDLIHEKYMSYDHKTLANKRNTLNRADKIIAISQSSKNDLVAYYGIPAERVTVISLATSILSQEGRKQEISDKDYLLYIGVRNHYKNFNLFVKAIAPLLLKFPNLFLYCAGGGDFSKEELTLFNKLKIINKIQYLTFSEEGLAELYAQAIAFIFPSLYEGFGIPMLEAMNCGCPVAAGNISSLPEVGADAALYFDPRDKESILAVTESLVTSSQVRATLREKGFKRAKDFSWQKTATLTFALYDSLAQAKNPAIPPAVPAYPF